MHDALMHDALMKVSRGYSLIYYGLLTIALAIALVLAGLFFKLRADRTPDWVGLLEVGAVGMFLLGTLLGLAGRFMCLATPRQMRSARTLIVASLAAEMCNVLAGAANLISNLTGNEFPLSPARTFLGGRFFGPYLLAVILLLLLTHFLPHTRFLLFNRFLLFTLVLVLFLLLLHFPVFLTNAFAGLLLLTVLVFLPFTHALARFVRCPELAQKSMSVHGLLALAVMLYIPGVAGILWRLWPFIFSDNRPQEPGFATWLGANSLCVGGWLMIVALVVSLVGLVQYAFLMSDMSAALRVAARRSRSRVDDDEEEYEYGEESAGQELRYGEECEEECEYGEECDGEENDDRAGGPPAPSH